MTSLQLLQERFVGQLVKPAKENDFIASLVPSLKLQPEQQLAIYQTNMRSALQNTLAQIYPVCRKIVGENYFKQLARQYINEQPSKNANLNCYGENLSSLIKMQCQQRDELTDFSYLSDLAQLEWFYHALYYAAEGERFDLALFSQLSPEQQESCSFLLAPQLRFIKSEHPILSIWQMNQSEELPSSVPNKAENGCIFREHNQLKIIVIDDDIYQLLESIAAGHTLTQLSQTTPISYLPKFIQSGWITDFKIHHVR